MGYFLDDFGNFENFVKIWTRRPPDYHQNASKNTRNIMDSSLKNNIFVNMGHQKIRNCSESVCPRYQLFSDFCLIFSMMFVFFWIVFVFWVYSLKIFLRRWGIENYTFSITKQHPNLDLNFIYVKKHEQDFTLNFVFSWNVP